jgi:RimJ/RimL family protein N-acetyltransferase
MGIILETNRLVLRTWALDDAASAFKIWGDAKVMQFVGKPFENLKVARRALGSAIATQEKYAFCLWAVVEKSGEAIIGCCGFHPYEGKFCIGTGLPFYSFILGAWVWLQRRYQRA